MYSKILRNAFFSLVAIVATTVSLVHIVRTTTISDLLLLNAAIVGQNILEPGQYYTTGNTCFTGYMIVGSGRANVGGRTEPRNICGPINTWAKDTRSPYISTYDANPNYTPIAFRSSVKSAQNLLNVNRRLVPGQYNGKKIAFVLHIEVRPEHTRQGFLLLRSWSTISKNVFTGEEIVINNLPETPLGIPSAVGTYKVEIIRADFTGNSAVLDQAVSFEHVDDLQSQRDASISYPSVYWTIEDVTDSTRPREFYTSYTCDSNCRTQKLSQLFPTVEGQLHYEETKVEQCREPLKRPSQLDPPFAFAGPNNNCDIDGNRYITLEDIEILQSYSATLPNYTAPIDLNEKYPITVKKIALTNTGLLVEFTCNTAEYKEFTLYVGEGFNGRMRHSIVCNPYNPQTSELFLYESLSHNINPNDAIRLCTPARPDECFSAELVKDERSNDLGGGSCGTQCIQENIQQLITLMQNKEYDQLGYTRQSRQIANQFYEKKDLVAQIHHFCSPDQYKSLRRDSREDAEEFTSQHFRLCDFDRNQVVNVYDKEYLEQYLRANPITAYDEIKNFREIRINGMSEDGSYDTYGLKMLATGMHRPTFANNEDLDRMGQAMIDKVTNRVVTVYTTPPRAYTGVVLPKDTAPFIEYTFKPVAAGEYRLLHRGNALCNTDLGGPAQYSKTTVSAGYYTSGFNANNCVRTPVHAGFTNWYAVDDSISVCEPTYVHVNVVKGKNDVNTVDATVDDLRLERLGEPKNCSDHQKFVSVPDNTHIAGTSTDVVIHKAVQQGKNLIVEYSTPDIGTYWPCRTVNVGSQFQNQVQGILCKQGQHVLKTFIVGDNQTLSGQELFVCDSFAHDRKCSASITINGSSNHQSVATNNPFGEPKSETANYIAENGHNNADAFVVKKGNWSGIQTWLATTKSTSEATKASIEYKFKNVPQGKYRIYVETGNRTAPAKDVPVTIRVNGQTKRSTVDFTSENYNTYSMYSLNNLPRKWLPASEVDVCIADELTVHVSNEFTEGTNLLMRGVRIERIDFASDCNQTLTPRVVQCESNQSAAQYNLNCLPEESANSSSSLHSAASECGNGTKETGESCDDGAQNGTPGKCNTTCTGSMPITCGNGVQETGENCDDGNTNNNDLCTNECMVARCGDGIVRTSFAQPEVCDDGENNGLFGFCNATCSGITGSVCGNNIQEGNEACDEGIANGQPGKCNITCTGTVALPQCSDSLDNDNDGAIDFPADFSCTSSTDDYETTAKSQCQDGQDNDGNGLIDYPNDQGCSSNQDNNESGYAPQTCGNGIREGTEVCDNGSQNGQPNKCNTSCTGITTPVCGNGIHENGEACDNSSQNGQPNKCNSNCTGVTSATCGNGIREGAEVCDDGAQNGQLNKCNTTCTKRSICGNGIVESGETCDDIASSLGRPNKCNVTCSGITTPICGNNIIEANEQCDSGSQNGQPGACNTTCTAILPRCGNRIIEAPEVCDDGTQNGTVNMCNNTCSGTVAPPSSDLFVRFTTQSSTATPGETLSLPLRWGNSGINTIPNVLVRVERPVGTSMAQTQYCSLSSEYIHCGSSQTSAPNANVSTNLALIIPNTATCGSTMVVRAAVAANVTDANLSNNITTHTITVQCTCGDGVKSANEICDDGGYNGSIGWCNATCSGRTQPVCGDHRIDGGETCDDGMLNGQPNRCNTTCTGLTSASCGNGVREENEVCDSGTLNGTVGNCNSTCTGTYYAQCGDGKVEGNEVCDSGTQNGQQNMCNSTCSGQTVPLATTCNPTCSAKMRDKVTTGNVYNATKASNALFYTRINAQQQSTIAMWDFDGDGFVTQKDVALLENYIATFQ